MPKFTTASKNLLLLSFFVLSSITVGLLIAFDNTRPDYYRALFALPFSFAILSLIFNKVYKDLFQNIAATLLLFLFYYRVVIIPLLMLAGEYYSEMSIGKSDNISLSIFLMVMEMITVFLVLYYFTIRKRRFQEKRYRPRNKSLAFIITTMFLFIIIVWFTIPESHEDFRSIFSMYDEKFTLVLYNNAKMNPLGSFKRIIITLFSLIFNIFRILGPAYIIVLISRKFKNNLFWGLTLSLPLLFLQLFFITNTIAYAFICIAVLLLLLSNLYQREARLIMMGTILSAIIFVLFYFISRFSESASTVHYGSIYNIQKYLSASQTAYFSGLDNVAAMLNLPEDDKWQIFTVDLIRTIPFNNSIFQLSSIITSQNLFNSINFTSGQIPPTIGLGYYYFGLLFSPVFSLLLAYFAIINGLKAKNEKQSLVFVAHIFMAVILVLGIIMYNVFISTSYIITIGLPLLILGRLYTPKYVK